MNELYPLLRLVHILSSGVLFGGGAVIAYFMLTGWRSGKLNEFYFAARFTVTADFLFTTTAVIVQPISGVLLAMSAGYSLFEPWLLASYALYVLIGICWLPVVWIQLRVRNQLAEAGEGGAIPDATHKLMRYWFWLGWPAFTALIGIFALMITKPIF
ncbi:DUF2269 family protein [Maricaulis sp. MIT060901]|uniref:DUF2269 family protein n=1 Tax=Maricaulis sp. MIT060901 TaxID=3096993 RepID=UPI00399B8E85